MGHPKAEEDVKKDYCLRGNYFMAVGKPQSIS